MTAISPWWEEEALIGIDEVAGSENNWEKDLRVVGEREGCPLDEGWRAIMVAIRKKENPREKTGGRSFITHVL